MMKKNTFEKVSEQGENKVLTTGIACVISLVLTLLFLVFVYGTGEPEKVNTTENCELTTEVNTEEKAVCGVLSFTADAYEIESHKDMDMSRYLQCSGLTLDDVEWSSTSEDIYVGSNGHISLNKNGASCNLIAAAKSDQSIKAECIVKTRSETEDFAYQVESLNGEHTQDEETDDGVVRLAYYEEDSLIIDIDAENYEIHNKNKNAVWDSSLFYLLEDDKDGQINSYIVEKKKFINKDSGNAVEYEIYHNPDTDIINKIVSIEYEDKKLAVIEYYYEDDGSVNSIYSYKDVNHTPGYAAPDRNGERCLYSGDTMVAWCIVEEGNETNYCIGAKEKSRLKKNNHNNIRVYSDCSSKEKSAYDKTAKIKLNAAYNTMSKIINNEGVITISGCLEDSSHNGIESARVRLRDVDYDSVLYTGTTDENGYYEIMIPAIDREYSLIFNKEQYLEEQVYEIEADADEINLVQETVYLARQNQEKYECTLEFYDVRNKSEDREGMAALDDLDIFIRRGVNNKNGVIEYQDHVLNSTVEIKLDLGMYTVQTCKEGYLDSYSSLFVSDDTGNLMKIYAAPELDDDEYCIVLTWEREPADLDSHLFVPITDIASDDYHICYYNMEDDSGNTSLNMDDTEGYGPEITTIQHILRGQYKYYVCDFINCRKGNEESDVLSNSSAIVRVYGKHGLIQTFNVPVKKQGIIWEVFEIRDGIVIPAQRCYDSAGNKAWWCKDK